MTPVMQTRFGQEGNCLMACVASILEREIADCPEIDTDKPDWWIRLQEWLLSQGYKCRRKTIPPPGYCIANGVGGRGLEHSCVALDGEIIHDPHPDGSGLPAVTSWFIIEPC